MRTNDISSSFLSILPSYQIGPELRVCRILNGMWQVAGGHGYIDLEKAVEDMIRYHDSGFTTWDLADIYGPAEVLIGEFRRRLRKLRGQAELDRIQALTKWVPCPGKITRSVAIKNVNRSLNRMNVGSIDLLQFHWWDYNNPYYMDALKFLDDLRNNGIIKNIGLTNFDTKRVQIMMEADLPIVSNQIQYSVIDRRPEVKMIPFCHKHDISLLAYGSLCGGLISDRYFGRKKPAADELDTLSLQKYYQMIEAWGGWDLFQELLSNLKAIAHKHEVSIANIATRYVLDRPAVAGVIIGTRLGIVNHRVSNGQVFNLKLDRSDLDAIDVVCKKSNNLFEIIGDCGDEYR
ncbi:MAG TPA: aldo/keto reductase [Nitrososphaeraceae archaeon]|nr:aldo/keto reductase [Nitrososphaeraceae archaeon]